MKNLLLAVALCVFGTNLVANPADSLKPLTTPSTASSTTTSATPSTTPSAPAAEKKWYDNISLRGYTQFRYNRLLETNPSLGCEQCDRSWGDNGGFFFRRVRVILFGQIHKNVYLYLQPDLASTAATDRNNFAQIRDAYIDVGVDESNEFRFRIGQSKMPFGFENLQSSQNRAPLDRVDALNSGLPNERETGVVFYWAPKATRAMFSNLVRSGLKGSGDYGVLGLGVYNGQVVNTNEANDQLHWVARLSYPMEIGDQIVEAGVQKYKGMFVLTKANLSTGVKYKSDLQYLDERTAASFILYPKPFGLQAEYNVGKGPEFNPVTDSIETRSLRGGYLMALYQFSYDQNNFTAFVRAQTYDGGKKAEKDARSYSVRELEIGLEWQPVPAFELVAMYTMSSRRYEDFALQSNTQKGNLLRLQAQVNY
jgi:hypothetical protein